MRRVLASCLIAFAVLTVGTAPAWACIIPARQEITDIRQADLVVRGKVVGYSKVGFGERRRRDHYGLIRLQVLETWKGEVREEWEFYWGISTLGMPEDWPFGAEVVIAVVDASNPQPPHSGPGVTVGQIERPDLHQVLQAPCGPPFIFSVALGEAAVVWHRERVQRLGEMMERMPKTPMRDRMRDRMEQMIGQDPARIARRRIAALRACVEEDTETCKAAWARISP